MSLKEAILSTNIKSICDIIIHCQTDAEIILKYRRYVRSTKKLITYIKDSQAKDKFNLELEYLNRQCDRYVVQTLHTILL